MSWSREFDEPIPLPDGQTLVTLRDAASYITALPKKEADAPEWQAAIEALMLVVEHGGPTMFARISVMRALNRHHVQEFNPSRKEPHRGRRKLKRHGMKLTHRFAQLTPEKRPQDPQLDGTGLHFQTMEHGGEYPDTMPQAIKVIDAEGRSCIYVPDFSGRQGGRQPRIRARFGGRMTIPRSTGHDGEKTTTVRGW